MTKAKRKKKFHWPALTQWASWGVSASLAMTAVLPVLPAGTPPWVGQTLLIIATVLAALTTRFGDRAPGTLPDDDDKPPAGTP